MSPVKPSSAFAGVMVVIRVYTATPEYPAFLAGNEKKEWKDGGRATDLGKVGREDFISDTEKLISTQATHDKQYLGNR